MEISQLSGQLTIESISLSQLVPHISQIEEHLQIEFKLGSQNIRISLAQIKESSSVSLVRTRDTFLQGALYNQTQLVGSAFISLIPVIQQQNYEGKYPIIDSDNQLVAQLNIKIQFIPNVFKQDTFEPNSTLKQIEETQSNDIDNNQQERKMSKWDKFKSNVENKVNQWHYQTAEKIGKSQKFSKLREKADKFTLAFAQKTEVLLNKVMSKVSNTIDKMSKKKEDSDDEVIYFE